MKKYILILIAVCISLNSCNQENPVIDNSTKTWNMLITTGADKNVLSEIDQPSGAIIRNNCIPDTLIKSEIKSIVTYGSNIYLLVPKDYKIFVFNRWNYDFVTTFDFSTQKFEPTEIAFANATDAYVTHKNSNSVSLLDIKFNKIAKTIQVGNAPVGIAFSKNIIVVANSKSNTISLIDTRTYSKIADLSAQAVPYFVSTSSLSGLITLVCLGNGKDDSLSTNRSSAYLQIINPTTKQITSTNELKSATIAGKDIIPNGLAVTDKDYSFVSTNTGLFIFNAKSSNPLTLVKKEEYTGITYNFPKEELIVIRANKTAFAAKQTTGKILYELTMPQLFGAVIAF